MVAVVLIMGCAEGLQDAGGPRSVSHRAHAAAAASASSTALEAVGSLADHSSTPSAPASPARGRDLNARLPSALVRLPLSLPPDARLVLTASAARVDRRLYVSLRGDWRPLSVAQVHAKLLWVYEQVARTRPELDVRVLLPCEGSNSAPGAPEIHALLGLPEQVADLAEINAARASLALPPVEFVGLESGALAEAAAAAAAVPGAVDGVPAGVTHGDAGATDDDCHSDGEPSPSCSHVCVGGTFDYLHVGHKLLLSIAAHCTSERLVCGVSDAPLLIHKALRELMQPVTLRMALVEDFLGSVKPTIHLEIVPLEEYAYVAAIAPCLYPAPPLTRPHCPARSSRSVFVRPKAALKSRP